MTPPDIERLDALLTRLKLTAIRERLDTLLDEAARQELTLRETLPTSASRRWPTRSNGASRWG